MKRYILSDETIKELNERLNDEYLAHYFYRFAANWCGEANYKKAAEFFSKESDSELEHAKGLQDYMVDFGVIPTIEPTGTKNINKYSNLTTLSSIIELAYEIELDLMNKYNDTSKKLFHSDLTTYDFLTTYRDEQREAVAEYNDLLDAIDLIDKDDKFQVLYFEQTYM